MNTTGVVISKAKKEFSLKSNSLLSSSTSLLRLLLFAGCILKYFSLKKGVLDSMSDKTKKNRI